MSNLRFPDTLAGLEISVARDSDFDVKVQTSQSRKELRWTPETYPLTRYKVGFEVLRSDSSLSNRARELQQALTHIARHYGQLDSFLLIDPADSSVTDHGFAVGDGVTASFQLQRTLGGDVIDASGNSYHPQTKPYLNMLKNSSFEASSAGLATSWTVYNGAGGTEPTFSSIVPGMNGGSAQRVSWGTNATSTKGITQSGAPAFVSGQWYTISFFARASGSNIGKFMGTAWNTAPTSTSTVNNPALTSSWQRYVFQAFWSIGTAVNAELFLTINNTNGAFGFTATSTFGDLDFDEMQVVAGQHGVNDFQPIPGGTPAAATATRTPSYWPGYTDGFEPIFDLNGDATIYEDGTWQGRRQLYPFTRTNNLAFSEAFDNAAWGLNLTTVTANTTTAPDGAATADKVVETAATGEHFVEQVGIYRTAAVAGSLMRISAYCKPAGRNWFYLATVLRDDSSVKGCFFNVSTGVIGTPGAGVTAAITYAGNGWYRCSVVVNVGTGPGATYPSTRCKVTTGDGVFSHLGDGASGLYVWGAMAEVVSNTNGPTGYIKTPSSTAVTVTDYTLGATGIFTPAAVPAAGTFYSWDGNFYRRVRFAQQSLTVEQLVQTMWAAKSLSLVTVKV